MDVEKVKTAMDMGSSSGEVMAHLVSSLCSRGHPMDISSLGRLDDENYELALSVIGYRRSSGWTEATLSDLFKHARVRLGDG